MKLSEHVLPSYRILKIKRMTPFVTQLLSTKRINFAEELQTYSDGWSKSRTRSSVVAVIADRTAYDIRYTGKLSNRFWLQVYELLVRTIRFNAPKL